MLSEKQKLNMVMRLGVELTEEKDIDVLLEWILRGARQFVAADAGSIYIKEGVRLNFEQSDACSARILSRMLLKCSSSALRQSAAFEQAIP